MKDDRSSFERTKFETQNRFERRKRRSEPREAVSQNWRGGGYVYERTRINRPRQWIRPYERRKESQKRRKALEGRGEEGE
jgi:hypothetical protein